MKRAVFLLPLLAVLLPACAKEPPREEGNGEKTGEVRIVFDLRGDDFAGSSDLEKRDGVAVAIEEGGHGEVIGRESGMGFMEITVRLNQAEEIGAIKRVLFDRYPEARYRIER